MTLQIDLAGTVALVTGASRGLGQAMALALAQAGADLALSARSARDLERTAESARAHGVRVETFRAELTDAPAIRRMVQAVREAFGRIDALVNNAGISGSEKKFLDLEPEDWDAVLSVNLRGAAVLAQAVARAMVEQKGGRIVNVASMGAIRPLTRLAPYCASKAGLVQLTRVMAVELARHNVRVNAVCPGYFLTPMNERFFGTAQGQEVIQRDIPVRRLGDPAELGPTIVYLASEVSSFMTGSVIAIDGGHTLT
jgi:NAD(P)-dependent dehydrogenase (short-subunit alcohol dehydrogenase family)